MFTIEPQVTVVKTGSFANWITAAAAVGTFVVVAKTAKKLVKFFTDEPVEEVPVEEKRDLNAPRPPKINYTYPRQEQPRAKVVQNMINLRDKAIKSAGKKVTRTLLKSALNQSLK